MLRAIFSVVRLIFSLVINHAFCYYFLFLTDLVIAVSPRVINRLAFKIGCMELGYLQLVLNIRMTSDLINFVWISKYKAAQK